MAQIGINTEDLTATGTSLCSNSEELNSLVDAINALVTSTDGVWDSPAAVLYREKWENLLPSFREAVEVIQTMGTNALNTAEAHAQIDEEGASVFAQ